MLVLLVGLGLGHDARAGGKVDWSEYLEPPGSHAPLKPAASQKPVKAAATQKKESRSVAKKPSAESRSKAKPTARSKRRDQPAKGQ